MDQGVTDLYTECEKAMISHKFTFNSIVKLND